MAQRSVDVVVADEDHQRSGETDIIELDDGKLLMAYTDFRGWKDDAPAVIRSCRTNDNGETWTRPETLVENEGRKNVAAVSFLRLSPNELLLFYQTQHSGENCLLSVRRSTDNGETFGAPTYCRPPGRYRDLCNDCVVRLPNGRIIVPFTVKSTQTYHVGPERNLSACAVSDDKGRTWRLSNEIYLPKRGLMEPKVIQLENDRLWMLMRTDQGFLSQSFSSDVGLHWSKPTFTNIQAPQAPFIFKRLPSTGDLLLIRNPHVNLKHHHQGKRTPLRCTISTDEGRSWHYAKNLESDPTFAWSYGSCTFVGDMAVLSY